MTGISGVMAEGPYFEDERVKVYCGDCLDVLPHITVADVILTDPPYNLGVDYGQADDNRDDYSEWCARWFAECRRIAPTIALTPGMANIGLWHRIADDPHWVIAWHKPAAMGRSVVGFNNWEPVLFWGKAARQTTDVITATLRPDPDLNGHPCPKPLQWATGLLNMLTVPDALVLDPFMGSGTTMRAARDMGCRYIGIELEERFCAMAVRRLDQQVLDVWT